MHGYETKEQRAEHVKALAVELADVKRAIVAAQGRLAGVPDEEWIVKGTEERRVASLEARVGEIEDQLRAYGGSAPQKRAEKRVK